MLAFTGIGWMAIHSLQSFKHHKIKSGTLTIKNVDEFGQNADCLWDKVKNEYKMIAVRNQEVLNILYPKASLRFKRIEIYQNHQYIGWAVFLDTSLRKHKQFGSMRVGSIVDCLAHPDHSSIVIHCALEYLTKYDIDIILANHSHGKWGHGFDQLGFFRGPSNFLFACSRELGKLFEPFQANNKNIYLMRADGDGPINL